MNKDNLNNYIEKFLKGKLSSEEELELLSWIKQNNANKNEFLKIQHSISSKILKKNSNIEYLKWQELKRKIKNQKINSAGDSVIQKVISYAAVLLAGLVISYFLIPNDISSSYEFSQMQNITAPYGARTSFQLPDSSIVWLNSGSELLFSSHFDNERPVELTGEAYFEVKKGETPFIVSTAYGEVEVKGTSFNVTAYNDENFETTLVEGSVNVLAGKGEVVDLRPGNQAVYTENGFEVGPVETKIHTSWTEGQLIFQKEYLPQMARRLERWYNVDIELGNDERLKDIHYTATIEMESFSEVLNLLKVTAPVDYTWDRKTRVIKLFYQN